MGIGCMAQETQTGALYLPIGDRREAQKEGVICMYVYLWLIHVAIWQKTTKLCKAIILQLKKKERERERESLGLQGDQIGPKGNQSWIFIEMTDADAEAEAPILGPHGGQSWLIRKDPDAGNDWIQEEEWMRSLY